MLMSISEQARLINDAHGFKPQIEFLSVGRGSCIVQRWKGFLGEYEVPPLDYPILVAISGGSAKIKRVGDGRSLSEDYSMPGDVAIIPRGKRMRWSVNGSMDIIGVTFENPETCDHLQAVYDNILTNIGHINSVGSFNNSFTYIVCNHLASILENPESIATGYLNAQIRSLELYVLNFLGQSSDGLESSRTSYSHHVDHAIRKLTFDLSSRIQIEEIADELKVSPAYLSKAFKQEVGVPPRHFLLLNRIKKAKSLLVNTEIDIASIASECGFSHQSHLTRNFTLHVGVSPLRFRKYSKRKSRLESNC